MFGRIRWLGGSWFDKSCPVTPLRRNADRLLGRIVPALAWLILVVGAAPAFAATFADRSRAVQLTGSIGLWLGWAAGLAMLLVPSTVSLTGIRVLAPCGPVTAVAAWVAGGPSTAEGALATATTLLAAVLVFGGELGRTFAQASAYGDERRFPLRPPGTLLAGPIPLLWALTAAAALAGPLLLAARSWIAGTALTLVALGFGRLVVVRLHRLSRRWLVFVPAGVVVHDHLVLAETSMFPTGSLGGCGLAPAGTEAADLTGGALGMAVEFRLRTDGDTVVLAATRDKPRGVALHVRSFFVSPTRPGAVIAAARAAGVPGIDA